ncbi:MAG: UvrD-helicase domain-containing protein [Rhodobacteraceae bacterium]|nr:UvrD-helicase domain-containing protein [Paracoccaceae bacterium]
MGGRDESETLGAEAVPLSRQAMAGRAPPSYLDGLNEAQREAVEQLTGPVLMLAGAGTGKTRALTTRIAHLLQTGHARPDEILAVTFTNKAAREMKNRVGGLLGTMVEGMPWIGTFHSICVKILRRHAGLITDKAGTRHLKTNFTILDTDDQLRLLKQLIQAAHIDERRWPARMLARLIEGWKNRALNPDKVPASEANAYSDNGPGLYEAYQERLVTLNACDFGDLLLHVIHIFQHHRDVRANYQDWFRFILVDEYQDTNVAQYLWLRRLAQGHRNICCVGDDDQSIYGWRGAEVGNILRFEKDFPGAKVVRLEQNYRSTPHILEAANGIIVHNRERLGKSLQSVSDTGHKVQLIGHWDAEEEARWVGERIEDHHAGRSPEARNRYNPRLQDFRQEQERRTKAGLGPINQQEFIRQSFESDQVSRDLKTRNLVTELQKNEPEELDMRAAPRACEVQKFSLDEIAILVRAGHQMRAFEDRFLAIGLPYRVIGGPRFYERMEIRDAMAYFRAAVSPDDGLAFERIVNTPKRGLGDKTRQIIHIAARENGVSLLEGARILVAEGDLAPKVRTALRDLCEGFARWHGLIRADDLAHKEIAAQILEESGYTDYWQEMAARKDIKAAGRLENLKELIDALEQFENLQGFLEHVSLIMDNDTEDAAEKVSIMTLHAAKGLEFPVIFLPGWEDGLFPSQQSMDERGMGGVEEERRLAYVGITRAEECCTISFAARRRIYGQWQSTLPSRFIDELPAEHVEMLTPPALDRGGFGTASSANTLAGSDLAGNASRADVYNSPGWRRLQARLGPHGPRRPYEAESVIIDSEAVSSPGPGDRVFHQKFGYGTVIAIEGDKLEVAFEKAGIKKVLAGFVTSP